MKYPNNELYVKGWNWVIDEIKNGADIKVLEDYADNSFDFNDFDRGALDSIIEINRKGL